jgi:hypothetical protein
MKELTMHHPPGHSKATRAAVEQLHAMHRAAQAQARRETQAARADLGRVRRAAKALLKTLRRLPVGTVPEPTATHLTIKIGALTNALTITPTEDGRIPLADRGGDIDMTNPNPVSLPIAINRTPGTPRFEQLLSEAQAVHATWGTATEAQREMARAIATAAILTYGDMDTVMFQQFLDRGIWNDHSAVQSALIAIRMLPAMDLLAARLNLAKLAIEVEAERYPGTPMTTDQARTDSEKELVSILDRIGGMAVGMMEDPFQADGLTGTTLSVVMDILTERRRQADKGWTPAHDDEHDQDGRLAIAGAAYALQAITPAATTATPSDEGKRPWESPTITEGPLSRGKIAQLLTAHCVALSPCNHTKRLTPREQLVRAGACIVAEIERIDRTSSTTEA